MPPNSIAIKPGFLTGRLIVSKANPDKNRPDNNKVSPDLDTPTDLPQAAVDKISASLNTLLADTFALYLKTKNFHWHVSGRHFNDYHLMLDQQSEAIFATTDQLAERVRVTLQATFNCDPVQIFLLHQIQLAGRKVGIRHLTQSRKSDRIRKIGRRPGCDC